MMPAPTALEQVHLDRIRTDHGRAEAERESAWWGQAHDHLGVSAKGGFRAGWWAAVEWLLAAQNAIDDLTEGQLLAELRKGPGSIFWPLKAEDPKFWADCPRCRVPVLIGVEGFCPNCTHEFEED